ncbi:hypothetical protein OPT61_g3027 [Boeremia exigua]|uniref:Uncharacterized protein n=1 Tax=Boeremia exigua TaxID=749465 RepID=A0ACC2IJD5_9PLEO|nr:hypothetical protein OPT61_g3027 [Boeremia exigua]
MNSFDVGILLAWSQLSVGASAYPEYFDLSMFDGDNNLSKERFATVYADVRIHTARMGAHAIEAKWFWRIENDECLADCWLAKARCEDIEQLRARKRPASPSNEQPVTKRARNEAGKPAAAAEGDTAAPDDQTSELVAAQDDETARGDKISEHAAAQDDEGLVQDCNALLAELSTSPHLRHKASHLSSLFGRLYNHAIPSGAKVSRITLKKEGTTLSLMRDGKLVCLLDNHEDFYIEV